MSDVDILERGSSILDAFAPAHRDNLPTISHSYAPPAERPSGAQQVAVHRDEAQILQRLKTLGAAAGQDWYYRFPVKNRKENRIDWIEGPTIKLANDLARMYGNCAVDARVQDEGDEWLIYARFTDFETGFEMTRPFQQRKRQGSIGGGDQARALDIALQIGVSKAIRNVVVNALQTFSDFAFDEARNALVEKIGKNLDQYKARVADKLSGKSIDLKRVEAVVGRAKADWLAPDVAKIIAMMKSVEEGMATLDETFPPMGKEPGGETDAAATTTKRRPSLDDFAAKKNGAEAANGQAASPTGAREADPSTGNQQNGAEGGSSSPSVSEGQRNPANSKVNEAKAALMVGLRKQAAEGTAALRHALEGISFEDEATLDEGDHDELGNLADEADVEAKRGGEE